MNILNYYKAKKYQKSIETKKFINIFKKDFKRKIIFPYSNDNPKFLASALETVFEELEAIIDFFEIDIMKINSDTKANSVLAELSMFDDFTNKTANEIFYKDIFVFRDIIDYHYNIYNVSQRNGLLISLAVLIQKKKCLNSIGMCREETFLRMLCDKCFNEYLYNFSYKFCEDGKAERFIRTYDFDKSFCDECKEKIKKYYSDKRNKPFCSICLENRIIRVYYNLREYLKSIDLTGTKNYFQRMNEYKDFFEKAVSLIYYEKELLPGGYGYFSTNYT